MISLEQLQAGIVIPVDKPRQWTSFQAVNKIKAVIRQYIREGERLKVKGETDTDFHLSTLTSHLKFKIGHAGTLDPLASGLLLVCIGKATKTIPQLQDGDKVYTGTMVFGATTPCFDLERPIDNYYPYEHITQEMLAETARQQFIGTIQQVPPMFSAVKIDGQRAYELARTENGERRTENGEPRAKQVQVYSFEITAFRNGKLKTENGKLKTENGERKTESEERRTTHLYNDPQGVIPPELPQADFRIHCGKGTYIRSLARDLGEAVGSGAFLSALRRERIGDYTVDKAIGLDDVARFLSE